MRSLMNYQSMTMLLVSFFAFSALGNSHTNGNQAKSTNLSSQRVVPKNPAPPFMVSNVQVELDKAKKAGKAAFIVVVGNSSPDTDKAMAVAKGANAIYKNSLILRLNRDDASNANLVKNFGLAGAPLPLVIVISSKGFPTGGYILSQATAQNIAALVPSPKLETVYDAIYKKNHAIVVFSKKTFTDRPEVLKNCKDAVARLNNQAVLVEVDMDDARETNFMNQLRINKSAAKASVTMVINKQGQVAGTSTTVPDAAKLVTAANTPVKGGCGPGCGPAGCGK